jgi:hypothetical protein
VRKYLLLALMLTYSVVASSCADYRLDKIEKGNQIVEMVEHFRIAHGKLPESLADLGLEVKEEGPIYYNKESESRYIVWFGRELGESTTYDSDTREWKP